jgi:hypothetical protein
LSALLSFLGGSAFRMLWGEISHWLTARQEHKQEMDRMKLQGQMDADIHKRNLEAIKLQSDLGVKTITVQRDADLARIDADAWASAVRDVGKQSGIRWIDAWNGAVRPLLATLAILIVVAEAVEAGFVLGEWTRELIGAILGIYVADRTLGKRGK